VEQYGLDELAASADAVVAGLGPLAVALARLAVAAGQAVRVGEMELLASERGREILRGSSSSAWTPRRALRCGGRG